MLKNPARLRLAGLLLLAGLLRPAPRVHAQDTMPVTGEPIDRSIDVAALTYDFLVDARLVADDPGAKKFRTLQAAYAAAPAGTPEKPTVIGIAPGVYQIPAPAGATTGLTITKNFLTLLGLTHNRRAVVLADNRGNRMGGGDAGGSSNGYVVMVNATGFTARNLTFLNYCNVDYAYPGDATKNLAKRSATITQAVALDAVGDRHHYENVAFCSRLDTTFIRTTRSYFKNVFIEGTDDFIGGGQVGVWEDCEIVFPTGSGVCAAGGIAFVRCKFSAARGMQFSKSAGRGVALIDCVMPDTAAWVRAKAPPRPNLFYLTYRTKNSHGQPARITDGTAGEPTFTYSRELSAEEARAFNPWNLLRAAPNGTIDDWDPANARAKYEAAGAGSLPFRLALNNGTDPAAAPARGGAGAAGTGGFGGFGAGGPATPSIRTGSTTATIGATVQPTRADQTITWSTDSKLITLSRTTGPSITVTGNNPGLPAYVPITATAANGLRCTAWVFVEPKFIAPPTLAAGPTLSAPAAGKISVAYAYELAGREDQSVITWSVCDDAAGANAREIAVSRGHAPLKTYALGAGDIGKFLRVAVQPKHNISDPGPAVFATTAQPIAAADVTSTTVAPAFRNFVTATNPDYVHGRWTIFGTWTSATDEKFAHGYGVRVGSQGAQLLYQNDAKTGDMRLALTMTPEKTEGSGFGSPGGSEDGDRVQKSDIYFKYDPRTKTGYALRFWRTTESTKKCRFQFFKITNGAGTPLDAQQAYTGVFKPNTEFTITVTGTRVTANARNDVDDETLSLEATITPNDFGGAGVSWFGTTPRGNSNTYSRFEITYPEVAAVRR
ncbi:MAG: hypothetical protein RLZZ15_2032 [Verrucomicrobiota bacterium]